MGRIHHPSAGLAGHLESLYARFPFDRSLTQDPVSCVRPYAGDPRAAEIAGLFAATLAVGNTTAIRRSFGALVARTGDLPRFVASTDERNWSRRLDGFAHRWIRGDQLGYLSLRLRRLYESYDSLEELFLEGWDADGAGFAGGIAALARSLRAPERGSPRPPRGYDALFPLPFGSPASPCKRLVLYVRWMARERFPDLGLWRRVPAGELRVPLDQHVHWIAYHVGLTQRRTRSWATVEEVSAALRRIDPMDPVRFDFVLCHTGISGDCPKERDLRVCGPCSLRPDCRLWRGRSAA